MSYYLLATICSRENYHIRGTRLIQVVCLLPPVPRHRYTFMPLCRYSFLSIFET